jgi:transposase-like protein
MKKNNEKLVLKTQRYFSTEFKKGKVKELVEKQITISQLSRIYEVSRQSIYRWLYRYSIHHQKKTNLVIEMESESYKTKRLQQQVAELERKIGQKQLEIDFLNKLLEIGSEELGFDLKKNFSTKLSNGTDTTAEDIPTK